MVAKKVFLASWTSDSKWYMGKSISTYSFFFNPCLTEQELNQGHQIAEKKRLTQPIKFVFVGRLEDAKGVPQALEIIARLHRLNIPTQLDIIGDSDDRHRYEALAQTIGIEQQTNFHGWLTRSTLEDFYAKAHFILLPQQVKDGPKY